jgi:myo-inositol-1(or 4)-monophosphatase
MLARGDLGAIVLYRSEGEDLYAGVLLAQEAGIRVTDAGGRPVGEWRSGAGAFAESSVPCLVAAPPEHHTALLRLVNQTVGGSCRINLARGQQGDSIEGAKR